MWEETGVNFFSSQVCLMCAGVNGIINNLHLVNTISKPTQNFSIWSNSKIKVEFCALSDAAGPEKQEIYLGGVSKLFFPK